MEHGLTVRENNSIALAAEKRIQDLIKPLTKEIFLLDTYIAGITSLKDETLLDGIKNGDNLILQREENNFDENAILVMTSGKKKLGYVPEKDNVVFAKLLDAGKLLVAKAKGTEQKGLFKQMCIGIYMIDF